MTPLLRRLVQILFVMFASLIGVAATSALLPDETSCVCRVVCLDFNGDTVCDCPIVMCPQIGNCQGQCQDVIGSTIVPEGTPNYKTCRCVAGSVVCGKDPGCTDCEASGEWFEANDDIVNCGLGTCSAGTCNTPSLGYPSGQFVTACGCR